LKIAPVAREPAKNCLWSPVAIPSGCHPFGNGIVSGYARALADGASAAQSRMVIVRMRM
jgi:hypothetical protein